MRYSETEQLTITRSRWRNGWRYFDALNKRITDNDEIARLNAIALPPAYQEARFNPDPLGHLQAIGNDARGRRQYRYHPDFRVAQESQKFALCPEFGRALPRLRKRLAEQLTAPATSKDAVIAAMVSLLDKAYLRIGNEAYRRSNKSFGLTTLRNRHARLRGKAIELHYRGKGGIMKAVRLNDRSLSRIVRRCQDLPGQQLFQYLADDGETRPVTSTEINAFLREAMGGSFTAKHFRTWHASVIAYDALCAGTAPREMLEQVAQALGNTPAVARKSYIHPNLLDADMIALLKGQAFPKQTKWLSRSERGFLAWIDTQAASPVIHNT